jgi:hypothetical protein
VAVRGCGGRGPYANSIRGRTGLEVCRGCAAGHNPRHFALQRLATVKECREDYRCRLEEKICLVESQGDAERASARRVFALARVVSCSRFDPRWRSQLHLGSGEPFDDPHGSATLGTAIKTRRVFGGGGMFFGRRFWCRTQQLKAKRQNWRSTQNPPRCSVVVNLSDPY